MSQWRIDQEATTSKQSPRDIQKRTFDFAVRVLKLVDRFPRSLSADVVGRQLARSATSVGAQVQEADAAESKNDFAHKMGIGRKEVQESRYWLAMVDAAILPDDPEAQLLYRESDELARILFTIQKNALAGKSMSK